VAQRGHEICRFAQAWMGKQAMAEQAMCIYIYIYIWLRKSQMAEQATRMEATACTLLHARAARERLV